MKPNIPEHEFRPIVEGEVVTGGPNDIVVCCGAKTLDILKASNLIQKNRTLGSLREKAFKPFAAGGFYMMTYDPGVIASEPDKRDLIQYDVRLVKRLMDTGNLIPKLGDYRWVSDFSDIIARIKVLYTQTGVPVPVSTDTETMGLYPYYEGKDILTIGFTVDKGRADMLVTSDQYPDPVPSGDPDLIWDQIRWLLTSPMITLRLANGKYDLTWIAEKWGIECTNFKFDTALVGSLLNENRSNGLTTHTKTMTDLGGYDTELNSTYDKGEMEKIPVTKMTSYFGGDLDGTFQVAEVLRDELLEDGELARFYIRVVHPAARAFEKLERRGVLVDQQKMAVLSTELAVEIKECELEALDLIPRRLRLKHFDKIASQRDRGKSPFTPALIKEYFFTPLGLNLKPVMKTGKTNEPSTARAHLKMFAHNPLASSMISVMERMGSASKTKSTFVDGFMKHIRPDGKLHPTYMLFHGGFNDDEEDESGTVSGRLSCKDPAFQTLPKKTKWAKRIRECFPAPPGKVIVVLDYSQGELRVVACIAPEKMMIAAYEQGLDLHAVTGAKLGGYTYATFAALKISDPSLYSLIRDKAKPANFGLLYGMGVEGFQIFCWASYGLELTHEEAEAMRNAFFELYPGLINYHEAMRKFVRAYQFVRSPMGRIRHLETIRSWDRKVASKAERQAINSPVQAALTDMMIWAIAEIEANIPEEKFAVVGMIHDALIAYADATDYAYWAGQAGQVMQHLPLGELDWVPQLAFPADGEAGPTLASLSKLKLAA